MAYYKGIKTGGAYVHYMGGGIKVNGFYKGNKI
jgi:hypothetical protein